MRDGAAAIASGSGQPHVGCANPAAALMNVTVTVAGRRILDGATLELQAGSVFLLLGQNGAGKTTLMRTLCGRTETRNGRVLVGGRDPRIDATARGAIGFVPQSIALYPELTVRENMAAFAAYGPGERAPRPRLDALLHDIRLDHVADRPVRELSGGYQRRANLGAALVTGPSVLLLDEPTVGVDAAAKAVLVEVIRSVARRGAALVMTTHDLEVAAALADRVGFLAGGRITHQGTPHDLLAEMFGGRFKVVFVPSTAPDAALAASFVAAGLRFCPATGSWRSPACGSAGDVIRMVMEAAAPARLGARRLEIVEPGLAELYDGIVGQDRARD